MAEFVYVKVEVLPPEVVFDVQEQVVTGVNLVEVMTAGTALAQRSSSKAAHAVKAAARMAALEASAKIGGLQM